MKELKNVSKTLLDQLYNKEGRHDKEKFLIECLEDDVTRESYVVFLIQVAYWEKLINKDLYEFGINDIQDFFANNFSSSHNSLRTLFSICKQYGNWAVKRGLNITGTNPFNSLSFKKDILPLLNRNALGKEIISEDQLWMIVELLRGKKNIQDLICAVLPFYGIRGNKNDELIYIKKNEIDKENHTIIARQMIRDNIKNKEDKDEEIIVGENTREVKLSEKPFKLLIEAATETTYTKPGKNTDVEYKLAPSEYVIRPLDNNKSKNEYMTRTGIAARAKKALVAFSEELEHEENAAIRKLFENVNVEKLSINNIYNSGKIHVLKEMETAKDAPLDFNDYKEVNKLFGDSEINYDNIKSVYEIYVGKK